MSRLVRIRSARSSESMSVLASLTSFIPAQKWREPVAVRMTASTRRVACHGPPQEPEFLAHHLVPGVSGSRAIKPYCASTSRSTTSPSLPALASSHLHLRGQSHHPAQRRRFPVPTFDRAVRQQPGLTELSVGSDDRRSATGTPAPEGTCVEPISFPKSSGPIGKFRPRHKARSMSSAVPTPAPSSSIRKHSSLTIRRYPRG